jgi:hypothetical protein
MAALIIESGEYSLGIDTGFLVDAFTLDDPVKGQLDGPYVLDGSTSYAEVADSVNRIAISRGRRDIGDQFSAGSMSFTMLDTTGIFNPLDTDSPTFDPANEQPGLAPLREVYLEREGVRLFTGRITNYEYNFQRTRRTRHRKRPMRRRLLPNITNPTTRNYCRRAVIERTNKRNT